MRISDWSSDVCSSDFIFTLALSVAAFLAIAYRSGMPSTLAVGAALAIWLISVAGESLADWQMKSFRNNPANHGKVCRDGLWGWSRHPNYFFERVHWLASVPLAIGAPWGWLSLRSEEHTSELQSLMRISYAVFCFTTQIYNYQTHHIT